MSKYVGLPLVRVEDVASPILLELKRIAARTILSIGLPAITAAKAVEQAYSAKLLLRYLVCLAPEPP